MKYFILLMILLSGCTNKGVTPKVQFTCIHPAILGGAPFNLPENAMFLNNGKTVFTAGTFRYTLVGINCIKVEDTK